MTTKQTRPFNILLVEDNPADIHITQEALKECRWMKVLHVVQDGVEALKYLNRQDNYQDAVRPDLILLDLQLPRKDGLETLAEIKEDPGLRAIPVVMLTISEDEQDVFKAYDLQVNAYIAKPVDVGQFIDIVKQTLDFWITNTTCMHEEHAITERR